MRTWRQVRVFTNNFGADWYHDLLWEVVKPWRMLQPDAGYYFSRYRTRLLPPENDNSDVGPLLLENILPQGFRESVGQLPDIYHRSVRLRFVEPPPAAPVGGVNPAPAQPNAPAPAPAIGPVEISLRTVLNLPANQQRFWIPDFIDYDMRNDLGGDRFSPFQQAQVEDRDRHGELVAAILQANCDLVLESFTKDVNGTGITLNNHNQNPVMRTGFQSVGHMLTNVWWNYEGGQAGVWAIDAKRGLATFI